MPGGSIDSQRAFISLRVAILTVSDSRDALSDTAGDLLAQRIAGAGHELAARALLRHDLTAIQNQVRAWVADPRIDAVISNGGTGLSTRDVVPEALRALFEREFEGFTVLWHMLSYESVGVSSMQ